MSKIIVQFPKDAYIRSRNVSEIDPITGLAVTRVKNGYYRGIVISGEDDFLEHYVDQQGNAIRQPNDGTVVYYSATKPQTIINNGVFAGYGNMELEAWSSTQDDGSIRKGIKVIAGIDDVQLLNDELKKATEGIDSPAVKEAIEAEMLMHMRAIARERFASILNRPKVSNGDPKSEPKIKVNDDGNPFE
jgi:hypothetical protein